ncbi:hypothetical protein F5B21DRAFT_504354 [Xylaria acuta]|nr:hypothetical protein F5B21DRAFT_504354 [Xylaria acuta]
MPSIRDIHEVYRGRPITLNRELQINQLRGSIVKVSVGSYSEPRSAKKLEPDTANPRISAPAKDTGADTELHQTTTSGESSGGTISPGYWPLAATKVDDFIPHPSCVLRLWERCRVGSSIERTVFRGSVPRNNQESRVITDRGRFSLAAHSDSARYSTSPTSVLPAAVLRSTRSCGMDPKNYIRQSREYSPGHRFSSPHILSDLPISLTSSEYTMNHDPPSTQPPSAQSLKQLTLITPCAAAQVGTTDFQYGLAVAILRDIWSAGIQLFDAGGGLIRDTARSADPTSQFEIGKSDCKYLLMYTRLMDETPLAPDTDT